MLRVLLERLGHRVTEASDGLAAVDLFSEREPDIVFLDALMPRLDGIEAARQMKGIAGERMVPVIFLTSLSDPVELARCLEAGGDDFLLKPFNRVILEAKIKALERLRALHRALTVQMDQVRLQNERMLAEQKTARRVFDNVANAGCLDAPNIRYHASPLSVFNGDVLFAANRPGGGTLVFLGDFTGHGLPAAIGAMPVAEIFYGMAGQGFGAADILREMNSKLRRILPAGMFCCGAMIEADFRHGVVRTWNGGLPDGWLVRTSGDRVAIPSRHLPLGILESERFAVSMAVFETRPGDQLLLMTDGFSELSDGQGQRFGEEGVREILARLNPAEDPFDALMDRIQQFTGQPEPADDLTVCCLEILEANPSTLLADGQSNGHDSGPTDWHFEYELRGASLASFNPLPLLLHICMEVPGLRRRSGEVYTLLSELYNNALEHGILSLSSEWKSSSRGFGLYYRERQRRLQETDGHFIRFSLNHEPGATGGRLRIVCEDSGQGFDFSAYSEKVTGVAGSLDTPYAGRGLELLRRMTSQMTVHGSGNRVEITYDWEPQAAPRMPDE